MARTRIEDREFIPHYIRQQTLYECNRICAHCGTALDYNTNFTLEHVIPLSKGGKNDPENYVALCETCNKEKSNDVVEPSKYYPYLPKEKMERLQKLFADYLESTDWLSYDNLFPTDQFDMFAHIPVFNKGKQINVPITCHVRKVRKTEAFEYLTMYKGRLSLDDKNLIPYDEKDLVWPYYRITHGDTTLMLVSTYIHKINTTDKPNDCRENCVYIDVHVNPELKHNTRTIPMLYNVIQALTSRIQATLAYNKKASTIACITRTPRSDMLGAKTINELKIQRPQLYNLFESYDNPEKTGGCILCANSILFQGGMHELRQLAAEQGYNDIDEFCKNANVATLQFDIERRLSDSKEITPRKVPEKTKKKDKKRKRKH